MTPKDIKELRKKAESGSVVAQTFLGICCLDGTDVATDHAEAYRLLSAAASKGASRAVLNLARMYAEGIGTSIDMHKAIALYETAANRGEFLARIALGRIFAQGHGVPVNAAKAAEWYELALAQKGSVDADGELAEATSFLTKYGEQ